ncbi:MAG: hypothetical protein Q8Q09_15915 [Deltaproteobacteria bacterium]|nr:hypothetical protein [Deltaproteobacteria bacterium]
MSATTHPVESKVQITGGAWASAWKLAAAAGALGLVGAGAGYASDPKRFAFSYLFAISVFLTLGLGMLFFVVIQHIAAAHWSVTIRRTAEFFVGGLPVLVLLFLPLFAVMQHFPQWEHYWGSSHGATHGATHGGSHDAHPAPEHGATAGAHGEHAAPAAGAHGAHGTPPAAGHDQGAGGARELAGLAHMHHRTLEAKKAWFGSTFFFGRQAFYLLVWVLLARRFFKLSTEQDKSKDKRLTVVLARSAPASLTLLSLTMTFAAFDWLMALDPAWFSTIFGVWIFAGSLVAALGTLIVVTLGLRRSGYLDGRVTTEHYHDLAKLLFGFNCFWAYIAFSQFFLIWYASIPEETTFYHTRWNGNPGWQTLSIAIMAFHFVVPFILLMSRNVKRRLGAMATGTVMLLVMHAAEMYWLVLPNFKPADGHALTSLPIHWMDLACLVGVGGAYLAMVFKLMTQHALIPVGDPRLERGTQHTV